MGNCSTNNKNRQIRTSHTIHTPRYANNVDNMCFFKIVMAGNSTVGKTSFVTRISLNEFNLQTKSTIGVDFHTKIVKTQIASNKIIESKLQIWDTAGQDRYRAITSSYYRNASCVIAMFSIVDKSSFDGLARWINEVKTECPDILLVVVGTKKDLEHKRQISSEVAQQYAISCGADYFEISALEDKGCNELINNVASLLIIQKRISQRNSTQIMLED